MQDGERQETGQRGVSERGREKGVACQESPFITYSPPNCPGGEELGQKCNFTPPGCGCAALVGALNK